MAEAYVGEIRMVGFNFAPVNWALCNGQLLSIAQNAALFSLLGTFYGGNGQTTFALPDLRGRVPINFGQGPGLSNYSIGDIGGTESVTLLTQQMPAHNHLINVNNQAANQTDPTKGIPSLVNDGTGREAKSYPAYSNTSPNGTMLATAIANAGNNLPHENRQPFLTINFIICLYGIFPSRG